MTLGRVAGVIAIAALAFAAAYLLTASGGDGQTRAPAGVQRLSFPAPAVALPPADSSLLPSLARAPRRPRRDRPSAVPTPTPTPTPVPIPPPPPPPPSGGGGGGDGGIIQG